MRIPFKKSNLEKKYTQHKEGDHTYWTLDPKASEKYGSLAEHIQADLGHVVGKLDRATKPAKAQYAKAVDILQKLLNGNDSPEKLYELQQQVDELIEKLGYPSTKRDASLKEVKKKARHRGEKASELEEAVASLEKVAAAVLALVGVFFILAPESPTITGLAVLNLTNPLNTSLSMAFGIVLIATSFLILLLKKK